MGRVPWERQYSHEQKIRMEVDKFRRAMKNTPKCPDRVTSDGRHIQVVKKHDLLNMLGYFKSTFATKDLRKLFDIAPHEEVVALEDVDAIGHRAIANALHPGLANETGLQTPGVVSEPLPRNMFATAKGPLEDLPDWCLWNNKWRQELVSRDGQARATDPSATLVGGLLDGHYYSERGNDLFVTDLSGYARHLPPARQQQLKKAAESRQGTHSGTAASERSDDGASRGAGSADTRDTAAPTTGELRVSAAIGALASALQGEATGEDDSQAATTPGNILPRRAKACPSTEWDDVNGYSRMEGLLAGAYYGAKPPPLKKGNGPNGIRRRNAIIIANMRKVAKNKKQMAREAAFRAMNDNDGIVDHFPTRPQTAGSRTETPRGHGYGVATGENTHRSGTSTPRSRPGTATPTRSSTPQLKPINLHPVLIKKLNESWGQVNKAFKFLDADRSGTVDIDELETLFQRFNIELEGDDLLNAFETFDLSNNGEISYQDFNTVVAAIVHTKEEGGMADKLTKGWDDSVVKPFAAIEELSETVPWNNRYRQELVKPDFGPQTNEEVPLMTAVLGNDFCNQGSEYMPPAHPPPPGPGKAKDFDWAKPMMDPGNEERTLMESSLEGTYYGSADKDGSAKSKPIKCNYIITRNRQNASSPSPNHCWSGITSPGGTGLLRTATGSKSPAQLGSLGRPPPASASTLQKTSASTPARARPQTAGTSRTPGSAPLHAKFADAESVTASDDNEVAFDRQVAQTNGAAAAAMVTPTRQRPSSARPASPFAMGVSSPSAALRLPSRLYGPNAEDVTADLLLQRMHKKRGYNTATNYFANDAEKGDADSDAVAPEASSASVVRGRSSSSATNPPTTAGQLPSATPVHVPAARSGGHVAHAAGTAGTSGSQQGRGAASRREDVYSTLSNREGYTHGQAIAIAQSEAQRRQGQQPGVGSSVRSHSTASQQSIGNRAVRSKSVGPAELDAQRLLARVAGKGRQSRATMQKALADMRAQTVTASPSLGGIANGINDNSTVMSGAGAGPIGAPKRKPLVAGMRSSSHTPASSVVSGMGPMNGHYNANAGTAANSGQIYLHPASSAAAISNRPGSSPGNDARASSSLSKPRTTATTPGSNVRVSTAAIRNVSMVTSPVPVGL